MCLACIPRAFCVLPTYFPRNYLVLPSYFPRTSLVLPSCFLRATCVPVSFSLAIIENGLFLQFIFTTYITSGSQHNIKCPSTIQDEIYHALDPPYEDLFDKAEGHAMRILSTEYGQLLLEENDKYEEVTWL